MKYLKKFNESVDPLYYSIDEEEFEFCNDIEKLAKGSILLNRLRVMLMDQCGLKDRSRLLGAYDNTLKYENRKHELLNIYLNGRDIYIHELVDEWFVCEVYIGDNSTQVFFKCDQWVGLLEFLKIECGIKVN